MADEFLHPSENVNVEEVVAVHPNPRRSVGRPSGTDSFDTRAALLREARQIFASQGYSATTNKEIAARVGITPGAIYHYFPSKAELFTAVYDEVQGAMADVFAKAIIGKVGIIDNLLATLDAAIDINRHDDSIASFLFGATREMKTHPDLKSVRRPRGLGTMNFIRRVVDDGVRSGEIDESQRAGVEDMMGAVLNGLARFATISGDAERHAGAVEAFKQLVEGTLTRRI